MKERSEFIGFRVSSFFRKQIEEYVARSGYLNISDFIRDALREKMERNTSEKARGAKNAVGVPSVPE